MCKSTVDTSTTQCQCDKGIPPVDSLVIPIEGFLGILASAMKGRIAPRWLCMSESAKLEYIAEGKELFAEFLRQELEAKRMREEGNPRAFFTG